MVKKLSNEEKQELLDISVNDMTYSKIVGLIASRARKENGKMVITPARFHQEDKLVLEANDYFNKQKVETTVGRFIFNKVIIEPDFKDVIGYVNEAVNGGKLSDIEAKLSKALLDDQIEPEAMASYLNRVQWLGMQLHTAICGSFTMNTLKPVPAVIKERDRLLREHEEVIKNGDAISAAKIEKQLLDMASNKLGDDPGLDLYKSGARGSFGNNFKNISVMKGPVYNPVTGRSDIVTTNFMEGIKKDELAIMANGIVTGAYPKAIGTATSGYFTKQITAALQAVVLDAPGTDCGAKNYQAAIINRTNKNEFMFRYVVEGSKLVQLNDGNINSYIGKRVLLRSPAYCVNKNRKICSKCAGDLYYKLGIKNAGMTGSRASSTLLNLSMKKFHDASTKVHEVDVNTMFL